MGDSGRSISRPKDGLTYCELRAKVRELEAENALLRQQLRDATCSPQFGKVLLHCYACGDVVMGRLSDHKCRTRQLPTNVGG